MELTAAIHHEEGNYWAEVLELPGCFAGASFDELFKSLLAWPKSSDLAAIADIYFRPQMKRFRNDPRFMMVAKRAGLIDYWQKSGHWPDFCSDPDVPYDCKAEAAKLS